MIELEGSLHLALDDEEIAVTATGSQLNVEVSFKPKAVRSLATFKGSRELAGRLSKVLYDRGLTMTISRKGKPLVRLGRDAGESMVGRLLGMPYVNVLPKKGKK